MVAAISVREDYDGARLRGLAKASKDANQTRRLLSLAVIYEGGRRGDAAALGGVGLQIIRDWVLRFNAEGPDGLIDRNLLAPRLNWTTPSARPCRGSSKVGRSRRSMVWCAGA